MGCKGCEEKNKAKPKGGRRSGGARNTPPAPKSPNQNVEDVAKAIRRVMNRIARAHEITWEEASLGTPRKYDNPLLDRVNQFWIQFKPQLVQVERALAMLKRKMG